MANKKEVLPEPTPEQEKADKDREPTITIVMYEKPAEKKGK